MPLKSYQETVNNTNPKWWRDPGMRKGALHIAILYSIVFSLGYDGSLLNGLQALPEWNRDFGSPKGTNLGIIAASYFLPKIPAVPIIAILVDKYGRKPLLYAVAIIMIAGAVMSGLANNVGLFVGGRILIGVGTACGQLAGVALIPELAHPRIRHFAGSFLNTTYYIGAILAAWLIFAMVYYPGSSSWSWRLPTALQCLGAVILLAAWIVPESPRWLMKNGRQEEAISILAKYHANGDVQDELVQLELREISTAIEIERLSASSSWLSFFKTRGNRRRFFILILIGVTAQWSGNGVVQYFLVPILRSSGITDTAQLAGINGGLAIWNFGMALTGASLVERLGRKPLFLISIAGMFSAFVVITGLAGSYASTGNKATGVALVPFIYIFSGFYSVALTPLPYLVVGEMSPLALRAKSIAVYLTTGNIAVAFNQFVNPIALASIGWKYYFVYLALLATFFTLFWLFARETKGLTTEEAAVVYEDEEDRAAALEHERELHRRAERAEATSQQDVEDKASIHEVESKA